jgi:hypothetical protein
MVRAEKATPGPIGPGTRFNSAVASAGHLLEMVIEYTGYDRPQLLASTTTMKQADIEYTLRFEPAEAGTLMRWSGRGPSEGCAPASRTAGDVEGACPGAADLGEPEEAP